MSIPPITDHYAYGNVKVHTELDVEEEQFIAGFVVPLDSTDTPEEGRARYDEFVEALRALADSYERNGIEFDAERAAQAEQHADSEPPRHRRRRSRARSAPAGGRGTETGHHRDHHLVRQRVDRRKPRRTARHNSEHGRIRRDDHQLGRRRRRFHGPPAAANGRQRPVRACRPGRHQRPPRKRLGEKSCLKTTPK